MCLIFKHYVYSQFFRNGPGISFEVVKRKVINLTNILMDDSIKDLYTGSASN